MAARPGIEPRYEPSERYSGTASSLLAAPQKWKEEYEGKNPWSVRIRTEMRICKWRSLRPIYYIFPYPYNLPCPLFFRGGVASRNFWELSGKCVEWYTPLPENTPPFFCHPLHGISQYWLMGYGISCNPAYQPSPAPGELYSLCQASPAGEPCQLRVIDIYIYDSYWLVLAYKASALCELASFEGLFPSNSLYS